MLRALLEAGIRPDLVVGTSVGAINGAAVAADPTRGGRRRLAELWPRRRPATSTPARCARQMRPVRPAGTHLHRREPLRRLLERSSASDPFEDLAVPFQCVAASIERAAEHWFTAARWSTRCWPRRPCPACCRRCAIGGEHFLDGGHGQLIPVGRAVALGAGPSTCCRSAGSSGRSPPAPAVGGGPVAFEIARRHRFARDMAALPAGCDACTCCRPAAASRRDDSPLALPRLRPLSGASSRAYEASAPYLDGAPSGRLMAAAALVAGWCSARGRAARWPCCVTGCRCWLLVGAGARRRCSRPVAGAAPALDGARCTCCSSRVALRRAVRAVGRPPASAGEIRSPRFQRAHYVLVRWFLRCCSGSARGCCTCRVEVEGTAAGRRDAGRC